jgi:hypothetical protein
MNANYRDALALRLPWIGHNRFDRDVLENVRYPQAHLDVHCFLNGKLVQYNRRTVRANCNNSAPDVRMPAFSGFWPRLLGRHLSADGFHLENVPDQVNAFAADIVFVRPFDKRSHVARSFPAKRASDIEVVNCGHARHCTPAPADRESGPAETGRGGSM